MDKYKLINSEETRGVWVSEEELIILIRICKLRSPKMYNKLIEWYEYLHNKRFDYTLLSDKKRVV